MKVNNSLLHHHILKFIVDHGFAPEIEELVSIFGTKEEDIKKGLQALQDDHGVVLHPNSHKIWVIHPFSLAPTNFLVKSGTNEWWGNCAWCSLGIAALLDGDVTITTTLGADSRQVNIHIRDGKIQDDSYWIHFPIPMKNAWDNVIYTCSTMLLFGDKNRVDHWCKKHRINKGDIQPVQKIWEFSKAWYGTHLNKDWQKWTTEEARNLFQEYNLVNKIWQIPSSDNRF